MHFIRRILNKLLRRDTSKPRRKTWITQELSTSLDFDLSEIDSRIQRAEFPDLRGLTAVRRAREKRELLRQARAAHCKDHVAHLLADGENDGAHLYVLRARALIKDAAMYPEDVQNTVRMYIETGLLTEAWDTVSDAKGKRAFEELMTRLTLPTKSISSAPD
jgi:hypothetical protein